MALDWSILRTNEPVDIAGNFARGYQVATTLIDKIHERNALAALANTPNDPSALATLYQVNPAMAQHFEARGQELVASQRRATLAQQYAGGDTAGARTAALGAGDFDLAKQFGDLDNEAQKGTADFWKAAGPIAYKLKQTTDPAARQALWAQAKPILQSMTTNHAVLDQFDPLNDQQLDAAIATSQSVGDLINQNKIEWHQQGENPSFATDAQGHPVGTQNPAVIAGLPRVSTPAEAHNLPPGSHFLLPDGRVGTVPGGTSGNAGGGFLSNNPGALRKPGSMGFQRFNSPQEGIAAQQALLGRYMGRGLRNVTAIVERYAPRQSAGGDNSDASVNNYIRYVSRRLGVNPQDSLSPAMLPMLSQAMREFETGRRVN